MQLDSLSQGDYFNAIPVQNSFEFYPENDSSPMPDPNADNSFAVDYEVDDEGHVYEIEVVSEQSGYSDWDGIAGPTEGDVYFEAGVPTTVTVESATQGAGVATTEAGVSAIINNLNVTFQPGTDV